MAEANNLNTVTGAVVQGHQVASGRAIDSPYPHGSILMQKPFFRLSGLDLERYHSATINLDISPFHFTIIKPDYHFAQVAWTDGIVEDFSFVQCEIMVDKTRYSAMIYYPHPETKPAHLHDTSTLEVLSEYISDLNYGDEIQVIVDSNKVELSRDLN